VAIVVWPDGTELHVEGVCPGVITTHERGEVGFGYDSVFQPDEGGGATFAEMGVEAKNAISHRGRAFPSPPRRPHHPLTPPAPPPSTSKR
jgi:XTP/dITP diphosphohydrolase